MISKYKNLICLSAFVVCALFFATAAPTTEAHDLISSEMRLFIESNPKASAADIAEYAKSLGNDSNHGDVFDIPSYQDDLGGFIFGYIELGFMHVVIGLDHILFIITIVLTVTGFWKLIKMSLTFTLAHSLTFILAGSTALSLSSRIVEPLIALSIFVFAVYSIFLKYNLVKKWQKTGYLIFAFGLIHGLGFAGLLQDLRLPDDTFLWSLVLFNVGIEVGQFLVIVLSVPILWKARKYAHIIDLHVISATTIAIIALWWMVERVFLV